MTRKDHGLFAGAAVAGFVLAAFQVWYVALPLERAARIDFCRWTELLDCFESLHRDGAAMLPVLAALAAVLLLEAALALLASTVEPSRGEAWLGIARLASFPASGLAIYVLLNDTVDLKKTSPSAVLIALLSVGQNVHALVRGRLGVRVRDGGLAPVVIAAAAALFGYFLEGAAGDAREAEAIEREGELAPPAVVVPDFELSIPREGAVALGSARARIEVLLFIDPEQEASRNVLKDALEVKEEEIILHVYLKDRALEPGARAVLEAAARGEPLPAPEPSTLPARHAAAAKISEYPTAIWKGGRKDGAVTLATVLAAARPAKN
jgi:hypothetical protein